MFKNLKKQKSANLSLRFFVFDTLRALELSSPAELQE